MIDDPRVMLLIARYGRRLALAFGVAGGAALLLAGLIVFVPPTATATEEVDRQTIDTRTETSAVVINDQLWEEGTELENSPVYLTNATPTIVIEPRTSVPAETEVTVSHELVLRIEATRDGDVFWESTEPLIQEERTVEDGEMVSTASIDVPELRDRLETRRDRIAGIGSLEITLELTVGYDTGLYRGETSSSTPMEVSDRAYWLKDDLSASEKRHRTITVEETQPPDWTAGILSALVGIALLSGAVAIWRTRPEELDVDAIRESIHRRRYGDWISTGRIPMWVEHNYVQLDTLEDVVDVAIDTQERVVHDRRRDLFAVISENVVYYYSKSGDWDQSTWPRLNLSGRTPDETVDVEPDSEDVLPDDLDEEFPEEIADTDPEEWDDEDWRNL